MDKSIRNIPDYIDFYTISTNFFLLLWQMIPNSKISSVKSEENRNKTEESNELQDSMRAFSQKEKHLIE